MRLWSNIIAVLLVTSPVLADLPLGQKSIVLSNAAESIEIGTVLFEGSGAQRKVSVSFHDAAFKDEFLSMRPFKCLEGKTRYYCHVPYPYEWKGEISETDLTDLEYALLFVQKRPTAYGIDLTNGIYYKLSPDGAGGLMGTMHDMDMDVLATPPQAGNLRPVTPDMLTEAFADEQWLPQLTIK